MASAALPRPLWRRAVTSGIGLVTVTIVASNLLRIASTVVLARVLSPADFGVVGLTAAILVVLLMISDLGFGVFIVQHPRGDDPGLLDVVWTVRLIRAGLLTLLLAALAGPLADLLGKPAMRLVITVTALHFMLEGLSSLGPLTAVRRQKLEMLSLLDIVTAVAQTVIGIALAVIWRNYWAIVVAGLIGTALKSTLSYVMFPGSRRRFAWNADDPTALWRFGRTVASAHALQILLSNVDKFALSRIFTLNLFGLYSLSSNLAAAPSAFTTIYPHRILLPAYAAAHRDGAGALRAVYYAGRRRIMLLYLVAAGGFIAMAPAVIDLLYDPRYAGAAIYLGLLAIAPALGLNNYAAREALIVVGKVGTLLVANLVRLGWLLAAGTLGFVASGPIGLVAAVGLIEAPVLLYLWFELRRAALLRFEEEMLMLGTLGAGVVLGLAGNEVYFGLVAAL